MPDDPQLPIDRVLPRQKCQYRRTPLDKAVHGDRQPHIAPRKFQAGLQRFDCFVSHENFPQLNDVTADLVYRIDAEGLRSSNALVAWLDGPIVDDGTACEIGMFAELVRNGGEQYRGIVAISTDIRLARRRQVNVVGGGMNLFVAGAIESCGQTCHTVDEVVASLREL